ncbi:C-C motif chemokine 20-like [Denticeps clupeoides]|uniref:C-C motif chemokine n=1 Tax=Denticeps clupeoides TaxID=299321 RepID=A0AAY4ANN3_9TELE|nr:C-C motif chemokine 20-like [Denticeps clupeoides]
MARLLVLVLCLLVLLSTGAIAGRRGGCCTKYSSSVLPIERVRGFSIQTRRGNCNLDAIILHTVKGKHVCVDPLQNWVIGIVNKLKAKVQDLRQKKQNHK